MRNYKKFICDRQRWDNNQDIEGPETWTAGTPRGGAEPLM